MSAAFAHSVAVSSGTFFLADSAAQLAERCSKGASNRDTGIQAGRDIYDSWFLLNRVSVTIVGNSMLFAWLFD